MIEDKDTLSYERNLRTTAYQTIGKRMFCTLNVVREAKCVGQMISHTTDLATKEGMAWTTLGKLGYKFYKTLPKRANKYLRFRLMGG